MLLPLAAAVFHSVKGPAESALTPPTFVPQTFGLEHYEKLWAFQAGLPVYLRNSLGTAVFGGMLVSTVVNLVFIPALYVLMQKLRGESKRSQAKEDGEEEDLPAALGPEQPRPLPEG